MKVLIIEDRLIDRQQLEQLLLTYFRNQLIEGSYISYYSAEDFLLKKTDEADILLLDVNLPGMSGLELAQFIREKNKTILIVLITNTLQYAINGYSFDAFDFILKPTNYDSFFKVMDRANTLLNERKQTIRISYRGDSKKVAISHIYFIEVFGHYVHIHHVSGIDKQYASLKSIEEKLPQDKFVKCNQSTVVNLSKIEQISGNDLWVNGERIGISRRTKKEFMEKFTLFEGG